VTRKYGGIMEKFKRNRYYKGKPLTSGSFVAEQQYNAQKLAFLCGSMFGQGVVYGCRVTMLYDDVFSLTPGVAVDRHGRMIVVTKPKNIPCLAVKGTEEILHRHEIRKLYLCYSESFSGAADCEETDYITEGYTLEYSKNSGGNPPDGVLIAEMEFSGGVIKRVESVTEPVNSLWYNRVYADLESEISAYVETRTNNTLKKQRDILSGRIRRLKQKTDDYSAVHSGIVTAGAFLKNKIRTPEIEHGFADGEVFVEFDIAVKGGGKIYGDRDLFGKSGTKIRKKAVKVNSENRTFELCVYLENFSVQKEIEFEWFAFQSKRSVLPNLSHLSEAAEND
jgi:hypothetical protein